MVSCLQELTAGYESRGIAIYDIRGRNVTNAINTYDNMSACI